ncbi:uncharacterized protein LOC121882563 [Scomber scombrus]|uniref:Uncharacterized protein LOC121882563 n=1 Tax=Scomber scombrus TaxID=13677 RepID=A0AAV1Q1Y9_SCOSC
MSGQQSQDQTTCSTWMQTPDALRIDLSHIDQDEVRFAVYSFLIQMMTDNLDILRQDFVTAELEATLAESCMNMIQALSETILDVALPQVYRYRRICGTFSPVVFPITEDQINACLGDSIQHILVNSLHAPRNVLKNTKVLTELIVRHISKTVNSAQALYIQTSSQESRVPVVFVSGCLTLFPDLKDMVCEIATILMASLNNQGLLELRSYHDLSSFGNIFELVPPTFCGNSRDGLKRFLRTYITRMVTILKSRAQKVYKRSTMSSSDQGNVCIIIGSDTHILTVEDSSQACGQSAMSSNNGLDVISGAVPDNNEEECPCETSVFDSVTLIGTRMDPVPDVAEMIKNIANELVQTVLGDYWLAEESDSSQVSVVYVPELKELTDRIFNLVMSGQDYQVPCQPTGVRMGDTVTYRKLSRRDVNTPGIVTQALYMRTEELVCRCAVQALLWATMDSLDSGQSSQNLHIPSSEVEFEGVPEPAAGDGGYIRRIFHHVWNVSNSTYGSTLEELQQPEQPVSSAPMQLHSSAFAHICLVTLVVVEILLNIDINIRDYETLLEFVNQVVVPLKDIDLRLYDHFHASLMGRSYKDIGRAALNDLLLEFGSVEVMEQAVRAGDPDFVEALMKALRKQLKLSTPPVSHRNTAKTSLCSFFKKFKRLCCRKTSKKGRKTPTVSSPTRNQDKKLQGKITSALVFLGCLK